ncbi:metallopeptidase TldD-related protein [Catenulispora pinisilvae]|uniref:metallopeptidase TldD-related protein n=1 Tax=Catenulispora pinisilvae TaxID=2705253 RepID=UPI001891179F|nr:metallopeptidase TldD-related protein [Catenulispora pinisilvae]
MSTSSKPQDLVEKALELSRADGAVVLVDAATDANLRWANNTLTTNGVSAGQQVTVISVKNGATGAASAAVGVVGRSGVDVAGIEDLVRASEKAAEESGPADDANQLVPGRASADWDEPPAQTDISVFSSFAPALGETFAAARAEGSLLFGYAEHSMSTQYLGSTSGLRLRHAQPTGSVQLNAKSGDRSRSAWAGVPTADFSDVDVVAVGQDLARRLEWAKRKIDLPAGRYETVLPPTSVADLMIYAYWSAALRDAVDGRSVFSKSGGATKLGESLAGSSAIKATLRSDPTATGLECTPYVEAYSSNAYQSVFDNGLALGPTEWIKDGELAALLTTRRTAAAAQAPVTPFVDNLILDAAPGGTGPSLTELTGSTRDGLLLTSLWYIREVDPQTLLLTGLTRDGVYKVEGGEVVGEVNNFRFNESPVSLLSRIAEAGRTERTFSREWGDYFNRTAMPALRIPDFNMSSVSPAS